MARTDTDYNLIEKKIVTQQARDAQPTNAPTLSQHCLNVICLLGIHPNKDVIAGALDFHLEKKCRKLNFSGKLPRQNGMNRALGHLYAHIG